MPAEQIDWNAVRDALSAGGWTAAIGLVLLWVWRAVSVVRKVTQVETLVLARLDAVENRQERMSERFFQEIRDLRGDLARHRDREEANPRTGG